MNSKIELFKNKELTSKLFQLLLERVKKHKSIKLMEFCGTHTHNIFQYGFRHAFLPNLRFIAGPGCPVCVTASEELFQAFLLLKQKDIGIITYGDLLKVPCNRKSLADYRAEGYSIEVVYSAIDSVNIAKKYNDKEWVFLGVGFETTIPATAATIEIAEKSGLNNLSILSFHKNTKAVIDALGSFGQLDVDGILLPGHVSAVVGWEYFSTINEFGIPSVVVGFEPLDILLGINELLQMIENNETGIKCSYKRAVNEKGNKKMCEAITRFFNVVDAPWRGLGVVKGGGYEIKEEFSIFDARRKFDLIDVGSFIEKTGCLCGEVLIGKIEPTDCPEFGFSCTPDNPIGPCMVSHEGTCLAYYKWGKING